MATAAEIAAAGAPPQPAPAEATTTNSTATTTAAAATAPTSSKPIHTLVLDTGPLIKNEPPVSTLLAQAECLVTIPSVVDEIRDPATRARLETTLRPFLTVRAPRPASVKFVSDFARKTGDLEVLSRPDLHLLALTYEVECERNGGDWRLRNAPTQKGLNGKSPAAVAAAAEAAAAEAAKEEVAKGETEEKGEGESEAAAQAEQPSEAAAEEQAQTEAPSTEASSIPSLEEKVAGLSIEEAKEKEGEPEVKTEADGEDEEEEEDDEDDDDGGEWITPSNLKKVQEKERVGAPTQPIQARLQAALLTTDFAMQNVALRVNLNLLSSGLTRITRVKTWVLRCHGCFAVTRQMDKQFCPSCGQATLTRTSCSTDASTGEFRLYLKRNFQYNKRGNVYSVPKPVHGSASGKMADTQGGRGGQNGWGRELILSEDQQEYTRRAEEQRRTRVRDMMDEDYLPNILTGLRNAQHQQRIRVGAGRNVNAKKRK